MARTVLALALLGLTLGAAHGLRPLTGGDLPSATRRLLDGGGTAVIRADATSPNPTDPCTITSISGPQPSGNTSPGDAMFFVPVGQTLNVVAQRADSAHSYQITGYGGGAHELVVNSDANGFESGTYAPQGAGHTAFVKLNYAVGVSPDFNSSIARPLCTLQIIFAGTPNNIPSPPPPPSPTPMPTPPAPSACSGAVPCYCQNGYCFNNGATLTTSCAPPAGQSCLPVTVSPSSIGAQYAYGYPATVNVCQCSPATNG